MYLFYFHRLVFSDIHGRKDEPEPEYHMDLPNYLEYKDLHEGLRGDFPSMSIRGMTDYLETCEKSFDSKCEDLYKER